VQDDDGPSVPAGDAAASRDGVPAVAATSAAAFVERFRLQRDEASSSEVGEVEPWQEGLAAYWRGDMEVAVRLFGAVPQDHPAFAEAQRYLGFNIAVRARRNPLSGLHHLNQSMAADPFSAGIWQDMPRAYWGATVQVARLAWPAEGSKQ
jgi:hypothetical protein